MLEPSTGEPDEMWSLDEGVAADAAVSGFVVRWVRLIRRPQGIGGLMASLVRAHRRRWSAWPTCVVGVMLAALGDLPDDWAADGG